MIEVKDITKSFDGRTVLHEVSATFATGKTNLIIGQSGSGKTVLMKYSLTGVMSYPWISSNARTCVRK